jgi:hypothetical protein
MHLTNDQPLFIMDIDMKYQSQKRENPIALALAVISIFAVAYLMACL